MIYLNGKISCSGVGANSSKYSKYLAGAGSGGSIQIFTSSLCGDGKISSLGGNVYQYGLGGEG